MMCEGKNDEDGDDDENSIENIGRKMGGAKQKI